MWTTGTSSRGSSKGLGGTPAQVRDQPVGWIAHESLIPRVLFCCHCVDSTSREKSTHRLVNNVICTISSKWLFLARPRFITSCGAWIVVAAPANWSGPYFLCIYLLVSAWCHLATNFVRYFDCFCGRFGDKFRRQKYLKEKIKHLDQPFQNKNENRGKRTFARFDSLTS